MRRIRQVARTLTDDAWQIVDAEGQHTARINGTRNDAVAHAHHQLAAYGGGSVFVIDTD